MVIRNKLRRGGIISLIFLALTLFTTGCEDLENLQNEGDSVQASSNKVTILKATPSDVADYRKDCRASDKQRGKEKICIEICHRPPGNPDNGKTLILPLQAIPALLAQKGEHSHLGACDASDEDDDDDNDEDNEDDADDEEEEDCDDEDHGDDPSDSNDDAADDSDDYEDDDNMAIDPNDDMTPLYCSMNYDLDNDCDGYSDDGGDDLYDPSNF